MKLLESSTVEFKREYSETIRKTVIAFANTDGGVLYIGIDDGGLPVGLKDIDGEMLKVSNMVRESIKPDVTAFVSYEVESIKGKDILQVTIQKGTSTPYYHAIKGICPEGVYVRQGASSVPASETAIRKMIKDTDGENYEEERSLNQCLSFVEAKKEFGKRKLLFDDAQKKSLKLLSAEGLYTNLGLLLSDQCTHTIKMAIFDSDIKEKFRDRREFSGSLLKQINDIFKFIDKYNRLRTNCAQLDKTGQTDYPVEAIREALANAIVHREYSFSSSSLISIFDDRIEFISIGGLVKGITLEDIMLGVSFARNEKLTDIFYKLQLIEAYGTGIIRIKKSYAKYHIQPKIISTDNAFKVILPNVNFKSKKQIELTDSEKVVMKMLSAKEYITRKDVQNALAISQTMAGRILKGLVDKAQLAVVGGGRSVKYVFNQDKKSKMHVGERE